MKQEIEIWNNPFSINLIKSFSEATKNIQSRPGYQLGKNNHHLLNAVEKYQANISEIQGNLHSVDSQLVMIKVFLTRSPLKKYYLQNGISELDYIQYHTDMFVHKIHSTLEIMKLLLNEVYKLKVPKRDCNWNVLCRHLDKNIYPMRCIDAYFKGFETHIELRNLSSHRGIYNDSAKDEIELDNGYFLYRNEGKNGYEIDEEVKEIFPIFFINYKIRKYKKSRIELIDKSIKAHSNYLKQFLTGLLPEYLKQVEELSRT